MKATGIVRRIDDLGRIVIPKEIRRTMRIREGDPLEIYTERDGVVLFKKYSPVGELSDCAGSMCEAVSRASGLRAAVTDRDVFVSAAGVPKRELSEKRISPELEALVSARRLYRRRETDPRVPAADGSDRYTVDVAAPIITEGDVMGCVVLFSDGEKLPGELETKLAETAAGFLSRHLES
ncbi:MAG: AbrB/MazE/SpoVT family DNA-binding domain-containing protein [Oscillospiraceae bacterium]|nr:AbrB/MazE/SpoVT family DNA-binding domain-containing protein [Oscillospiraceae bacterium]